MKILYKIIAFIFCVVLMFCTSCGGKTEEETSFEKEDKHLNITILLDLSDRVDTVKYPSIPQHYERDLKIVKYFTQLFKSEMKRRGAFGAKGKMKVIFSPSPAHTEINSIVSGLNVDLSNLNTSQRKKVYGTIEQDFEENLRKIYEQAIQTKKYFGSDVWKFFKDDVTYDAVDDDSSYRNILVLLTDGYVYHEKTRKKKEGRTSYLTATTISNLGLKESNWREQMSEKDMGYMTTRNDLSTLEVLVMEVNPSKKNPWQGDLLKEYFKKWFSEMGVSKYEVFESFDNVEQTKRRIDGFVKLNKK